MKAKTKQKQIEVGRIVLSDEQDLVASIVNDEKLDIRVFMNTDSYTGPTKRGIRFYLFDDIWPEFKKLIEKVDKTYEEL
ncbi:MAG: hypothetical protein GH144_01215 [Clostridia bacterium]|jgi:hypothetical protein|nr:hypothetical protein [Clostridia bacterium]